MPGLTVIGNDHLPILRDVIRRAELVCNTHPDPPVLLSIVGYDTENDMWWCPDCAKEHTNHTAHMLQEARAGGAVAVQLCLSENDYVRQHGGVRDHALTAEHIARTGIPCLLRWDAASHFLDMRRGTPVDNVAS